MIEIKKDAHYLITGASGFLGHSLIKRLLPYGCTITAFARNEGNLIKLKQEFPQVNILPGSVENKFELHQACKGVDGIFHLAAFKHVGMAEKQSYECIVSNIVGSMNVCEEAMINGMKFVIGISTDKAAQVVGVYGASKRLMESLFSQFEKVIDTKFRIIRYGNVLHSTGSVLPIWIKLIQEDKELIVTNPEATRFYWTVEQAVDSIFECMKVSTNSDPYCSSMKSVKISDLLQATFAKYSKPGQVLRVKEIGLQPGENMHEKILDNGKYSNEVEKYTPEEIIKLI